MSEYKVGDKFEVINVDDYADSTHTEVGEVHVVERVDTDGDLWFTSKKTCEKYFMHQTQVKPFVEVTEQELGQQALGDFIRQVDLEIEKREKDLEELKLVRERLDKLLKGGN
jgi:hypothetical protein